jgi:galactitol-specific phosphotransferase system IIB component
MRIKYSGFIVGFVCGYGICSFFMMQPIQQRTASAGAAAAASATTATAKATAAATTTTTVPIDVAVTSIKAKNVHLIKLWIMRIVLPLL